MLRIRVPLIMNRIVFDYIHPHLLDCTQQQLIQIRTSCKNLLNSVLWFFVVVSNSSLVFLKSEQHNIPFLFECNIISGAIMSIFGAKTVLIIVFSLDTNHSYLNRPSYYYERKIQIVVKRIKNVITKQEKSQRKKTSKFQGN